MHKYLIPFSNLKEEVIDAIVWYYGSIIHYDRTIATGIYENDMMTSYGKDELERIYAYYLEVKGEKHD